ncbi:TlpA family protein disulfide reductase [Paenibacillus alba]|uniref:TlpA family protein disulfide reductase n=1 Tax=Paenibacillus alba TaxID=1197127 RepID=UPI0015667870|nr:TlpA disulfide reductase family protein [Paenibacillus alba]NQX65701.1 TlpA family protein disulfide reductase [Paenibacillus alba]
MSKKVVSLVILVGFIIIVSYTLINHFSVKPVDYIMSDRYDGNMIDFSLKDIDGRSHAITGNSGKPKLINFWTSWCKYCKKEAEELNKLYSKYGSEIDFVSVNVTTSDNVEDAQKFIREYHVGFPVLYDDKGTVSSQYRVMGIPTNYFVRKDGTILAVTEDVNFKNADELIKKLIGAE